MFSLDMLGKSQKPEELKAKYRELVQELEAKESQWSALEEVLRTAVVRLAIAASGQNQRLDQQLNELKKTVKSDSDARAVNRKLGRVTKTLTNLDLANPESEGPEEDQREWFLDLAHQIRLSEKTQPGVKKLIAEFQRGKIDLEQAINHLSLLINQSKQDEDLEGPAAGNELSPSGIDGFIERLELPTEMRNRLMDATSQRLSAREVFEDLAQQLNDLLSSDTPSALEKTSSYVAAESRELELYDLIVKLTQEFDGMTELQDPLNQILGRLDSGVREDEWPDLLSEIADHITSAVHSARAERAELEEFLATVTHQLDQFEQWTAWQNTQAEDRHGESRVLEEAVTRQVMDMREDVETADDLTALKARVQERLNSVADHIKTFRDQEDKRIAEFRSRNTELQEEITGLKGKTKNLIKLWGHQRNRLMYDTLTNVYSRYAYDQRLIEEFQRWQRHRQPLAFCIWDIDYFKRVNDTYGHRAGDRLLQIVAGILSGNTRAEDFLARIGGEEFVMLLPSTEPESALRIANKLRQKVENTQFHHQGTPENITISCGITNFRDTDTPLVVYQRADSALYQAKKQGRNCCVNL